MRPFSTRPLFFCLVVGFLIFQGSSALAEPEIYFSPNGGIRDGLPRAKGGARPVILSAEAQKILRIQLERHQSEWVFPSRQGQPYDRSYVGRVFRKAARAAGLKDFHFHDLRHHGATMALNLGFTAPIVMALGGWKPSG